MSVFFAATAAIASAGHAQSSNTTPLEGQTGFLNGGFGEEQADLMRDMTSRFPVRFTFSRHNGTQGTDEFVADVHLRIVDSGGRTVLDRSGAQWRGQGAQVRRRRGPSPGDRAVVGRLTPTSP